MEEACGKRHDWPIVQIAYTNDILYNTSKATNLCMYLQRQTILTEREHVRGVTTGVVTLGAHAQRG